MCNQINKILCLILFQFVILVGGSNTKVIKSYSISKNFGTETRELSQSTIVRYNSKKQLLDSTLYIHTGIRKRLQLKIGKITNFLHLK